ncbi:helix-turn-helix transcriptional regulator [Roseateles sp. DXS20W]|uniref:Helix-turn-helix transcriptional regulator n=1 Tax=Pelomonas lactea TaxID=3299030 RepID=A0ABW7GHB0_9BURK
MSLQRYEQVSQAPDLAAFRQGLVDFAHDQGFGLVVGVLAVERLAAGGKTDYFSVGNTPEKFLQASRDPAFARRDPVHTQLMRRWTPLVYDQDFYVRSGAADLWDMVAPFGYRTGVAVAVNMPGHKRLLLGMDREEALPKNTVQLNRIVADLQLLAVHAQDAAARLLLPQNSVQLPARQLQILRLTQEGKSAWVVGHLLGISENTVNYHLKRLFQQLDVSTKGQAVVRAMELGLL